MSADGTPPDEHAERQILGEKYRQTRRTSTIVFGTLLGLSFTLAFYEYWQGKAGSAKFYGGLFLSATCLLNMLYYNYWFYARWRDPLQIRAAEMLFQAKQKVNEKQLMRMYGTGIILIPIIITIVFLFDWWFHPSYEGRDPR